MFRSTHQPSDARRGAPSPAGAQPGAVGLAQPTRAARGGRRALIGTTAALAAFALTGCSLSGASSDTAATDPATTSGEGTSQAEASPSSVTLVTHDAFTPSEGILDAFTEETGIEVTVVAPGDGGALVNQLVLTKESPLGDVVYGVDNTYASRGLEEDVFAPYTSPVLPVDAGPYLISDALTPIDMSDVCLNVDTAWYEANGQTPPQTFEDLTKPEYAGQTVVTNPATSSPGLAFLLATIGEFGEDGYLDYWTSLRANDLLVVDGWSDAYYVDFTGGGGEGTRPVVLSYASSPPYTVGDDGEPTTAALLTTCFRQVEYAGVLTGAENPEGAQALVDFLLSETFQADLPTSMYVYPINGAIELPAEWEQWAPLAESPLEVPAEDITANRSDWIDAWTQTVLE